MPPQVGISVSRLSFRGYSGVIIRVITYSDGTNIFPYIHLGIYVILPSTSFLQEFIIPVVCILKSCKLARAFFLLSFPV